MNRFKNTRIRIERLKDGQIVGGWFIAVFKDRLIVDLNENVVCEPGEPVRLHMICNSCEATIDSSFTQIIEEKAVFSKPSSIRIQERKQDPRFKTDRATVMLKTPQRTVRATDVDVSMKGLGLEASSYLEVGEKAEILYDSEDFTGTLQVECRYCHVKEDGTSRMGFRIIPTDRILYARWVNHIETVQNRQITSQAQAA